MAARIWTGLIVLLAIFATALPAEAKKDAKKQKQPKAREVYFYSTEVIPPRDAYLRDVMDSASLIGYVRKHISTVLAKKRYLPYNYKLVANRGGYKPQYGYLEVTTEIFVEKPDVRTFVFEVKMSGTFYESKGGKKIKSFKGKAKKKVADRFKGGLIETIQAAYEPMEAALPTYREY